MQISFYPISLRTAFCLLGLCLGVVTHGQNAIPTKGKDFWLGFMKNYETNPLESLDLFIVSDVATSGTVSVPGQGWTQSFSVSPNQTTTVTIPNNIGEMYSNQVVEGKGIHVETQDTVAVFAISFNPYTADGTKILPIQTLGINYRVAAYSGLSPWDSELVIVATEDGTEVEITPSVSTLAGNPAGVPFTVQLNEGQSYQIIASAGKDLTGTLVKGTAESGVCRPFAVFSGAGCTNIPVGCAACDHIYEQNFPVELWGTDYYVTPFVFNLNPQYGVSQQNYTYRVLAHEPGTLVSIDGAAPVSYNAGQFQEFQYQTVAHCVKADKPITVIQYMEGITCGGNGDPAMLILDDVTKKIDNITFSTVESSVITSHYINLVIDEADLGLVTLDGVPVAPNLFKPFPSCPGQLWAGFQITEGSHVLDVPGGGVTGYVYGNGDAESYAYSVGSYSPVPPLDIDEVFCSNSQVVLQVPVTFYDPYWYNYTNPDSIIYEGFQLVIPAPIETGIYVGVANELLSGCEEEFYFSVEAQDPPDFDVFPDAANICSYENVPFNVVAYPSSAFFLYEWSPTTGLSDPYSQNPVATPFETTTYTVTVSTPTGCAVRSDTVTVVVNDGVITKFLASEDPEGICPGESVALSVETEAEVWADDFDPQIDMSQWGAVSLGSASDVCGSVSGEALYFNGAGNRSATTIPLDCSNGGTIYFSLKIANGSAPCDNAEPGDNVLLEYSLDGTNFNLIQTFFESGYPDFTAISVPIPAAAESPNTLFRWRQTGVFSNNQDNWALDNVYIGTIQTDNFDYSWSPPEDLTSADGPLTTASPIISTLYFVGMVDPQSGCDYSDSVLVSVAPVNELLLSPDTAFCGPGELTLEATPIVGQPDDYSFSWTPVGGLSDPDQSSTTANVSQTTTYKVVVSEPGGCSTEREIQVVVNDIPDIDAGVSDSTICPGEQVTLTGSVIGNEEDFTVFWSPEGLVGNESAFETSSIPPDSTMFYVRIANSITQCEAVDSILVAVDKPFVINASPDSIYSCVHEGKSISVSHNYPGVLEWSWQPSSLVSDADEPMITIMADTTESLHVEAVSPFGCMEKDSVRLVLLFETTDLGADLSFCEDENVTIETGWPESYDFSWSTGDTTSAIVRSEGGVIQVEVISPDGCVSSDEIVLTEFYYPVVNLGADTTLCGGQSLLLDAGPGDYNYQWSSGEKTQTIVVTNSGDYSVVVDNGYCYTTDQLVASFSAAPQRPFRETATVCFSWPPYELVLDAANEGFFYSWSTGDFGRYATIKSTGEYGVTIMSPEGCDSVFTIYVEEKCPGAIYIPNSFSPDGDGINDVWFVDGNNIEYLHVMIYNRWGELLFETNDPEQPWLGQRRDGNTYVEDGVYLYLVKAKTSDEAGKLSPLQEFNGHVTVFR